MNFCQISIINTNKLNRIESMTFLLINQPGGAWTLTEVFWVDTFWFSVGLFPVETFFNSLSSWFKSSSLLSLARGSAGWLVFHERSKFDAPPGWWWTFTEVFWSGKGLLKVLFPPGAWFTRVDCLSYLAYHLGCL